MRRPGTGLPVAAALVAVALTSLPTTAANAAPGVPRSDGSPIVGECYDLSDERIDAGTAAGAIALGADGYWSADEPVPCSSPHTFEVTEAAVLPMDVNAFEFAEGQCGALDVWNAVGVNRAVAGVVEGPLRIEPRSYAVRQAPARYVCGAVAVTLDGRRSRAVPLTASIERLNRRERAALLYCSAPVPAGSSLGSAATVPCSTRPRWQVRSWVLWTAFYDEHPGRGVLRSRAAALCGAGNVASSIPSPAAWKVGVPRTWCYREFR